MTLLGKIFTVLIFIQSLVFMSFAVGVYAMHRNWRDVVERSAKQAGETGLPKGLKLQLEDERALNEQLNEEKLLLENQLSLERAARRKALAALESRRRILLADLARLNGENLELVQTSRNAVLTLKNTQNNLTRLYDEVEDLRGRVRTVQRDRDSQFQRVVEMTDRIHAARIQKSRFREREQELVDELTKRREVMERKGWDETEPVDKSAPKLDGVVTAVSSKGDLVEVSLGSDDGLREGHFLEVFDAKSYAGRIKIYKVSPDRSVGQMIPEYRKRDIKRGDRVATRFTKEER
jgi:hypothetical protein